MDAYLRFQDPEIKGDSEDKDHAGWIQVSSWEWGLEMKLTTAKSTGGARTAGQVQQRSFTFDKPMDKTTFDLYKHMCKGTHFKKVTLEVMRAIGEGMNHKMTFCTYELESVVIEDLSLSGGDDAPTETLKLNPGVVKYVYSHVDPKDPRGAKQEKFPFGWDFIANKPTA
jgi:type VI secretion system secreted protein Hcp